VNTLKNSATGNPEHMDLIDTAMTAGGAIIGVVGTLIAQKKRDKRDDFSELVNKWQTLFDEVQKREQRCEERLAAGSVKVDTLQLEILDLQRKLP